MASSPYPAPPGAKGVLNSNEPLPLTPQEITPKWCTEILGRKVKTVTIAKEIHSTASKILVDLTYEGEHDTDEQPSSICVKGGFNKALVELYPSLLWTYRREAEFYFYTAPNINMSLPKIWHCGTDTGAKEEDFPWLAGDKEMGGNPLQAMVSSLLQPGPWEVRFKISAAPPLPESIANRERLERAFRTMWATENAQLRCVIHGDSHIGSTFITADGRPGFIDWQGPHAGVNVQDLAYFVTGVMTVEDRRSHEVDLVKYYLQALHHNGGPRFEKDDVWHDYRKHTLHGLAWALAAPGMQSDGNIFAMTKRHVAAVSDHETIELLESLPEYVRG